MTDWTAGPAEYNRVRDLLLDAPLFGRVNVRLTSGATIDGVLADQKSGNDAGEIPGRPATRMWAELTIRLNDRTEKVVSVREIESMKEISLR